MENAQAIPGTLELINRLHQKLTINVTSTADALAKQRKLGAEGWAPAQLPDGGYFFPLSMAENFDFTLIGGRYFEYPRKNKNNREITVKCVEHLGLIYTCREYAEEDGGQEKGAKVKYSRGGKPTDRPHIKEGAGGDKPGYVSLITFVGAGRSIQEYEKPRARNAQQTSAAPPAAARRPEPAAQPAPANAQAAPAPAAAPSTAATTVAESVASAAEPAPRALAAVPPKVDLLARWTALGRDKSAIAAWLAEQGVSIPRGAEPTEEQKATIHAALLKLETKAPSPLERWKTLGNDPKHFVGWLTSLGISIPERGYFDPTTLAKISVALAELESNAVELAEFEEAAQ